MKKQVIYILAFTVVYVAACFLFIGACAATDKGGTPKLASGDQPAYVVPEGKKQRWESIQNMVKREYDVCVEHCGNDTDCLNKCEKAYKTRLEREYKGLTYK